jgi:hypothetical protein
MIEAGCRWVESVIISGQVEGGGSLIALCRAVLVNGY